MPALIPIGAAIVGGVIASKGANKAADTQAASAARSDDLALQAQRESAAAQQRQYDQARADNEPWRTQGAAALNKLAGAPDFSFTGANVATDPGYQSGLAEGNRALTNSAAARGGLLSGAALKASTRYAQDYAGTKFNESYNRALQTDTVNKNRLQSLAGIGQTAVGQNNAMGMQLGQQLGANAIATGQQMGQNALGVGNARASSYIAQGNALTNTLNQGVSAWNQYNQLGTQPIREGAYNTTAAQDYYGTGYSP